MAQAPVQRTVAAAVSGLLLGVAIGCGGAAAPQRGPTASPAPGERSGAAVVIPDAAPEPGDESEPVAFVPIGAEPRERDCCSGRNDCKGLGSCAVEGAHDCAGKNECKGLGGGPGDCDREVSDCCAGMNECKGQGGCKTAQHTCQGQNECKGKGGCRAHCPK